MMPAADKLVIVGRQLGSAGIGRPYFAALVSFSRQSCSKNIDSRCSATTSRRPTLRRGYSTSLSEHRKTATISDTPAILCDINQLPNGQGNVATVTVSNPRKLNIVNTALFLQLLDTFQKLAKDESLRAVVLTGAKTQTKAQAFIGGADIAEMFAIDTPDQARSFIAKMHDVCTAIRTFAVPVIAKIDGFCLGAGLEIMASCDLRIATRGSVFGMPEVKVGIPCVVEARLLCDLVGWGRARRLFYLAENIDSARAEAWGLVEAVVTDKSELDKAVEEWLKMIAQSGPLAIRAQKMLCNEWEGVYVDEGIEAGVECFAKSFEDGGQESKKLMEAFLKRKR
jgi:enoyl-CoA hydratase/carnithine racemase